MLHWSVYLVNQIIDPYKCHRYYFAQLTPDGEAKDELLWVILKGAVVVLFVQSSNHAISAALVKESVGSQSKLLAVSNLQVSDVIQIS